MKYLFKAALMSTLLMTTSPAFAGGSDSDDNAFAIVGAGRLGDPGNMKCRELTNIEHRCAAVRFTGAQDS